jgi:hypothetical protein
MEQSLLRINCKPRFGRITAIDLAGVSRVTLIRRLSEMDDHTFSYSIGALVIEDLSFLARFRLDLGPDVAPCCRTQICASEGSYR